jgi:amidase
VSPTAFPLEETTIEQIHAALRSGEVTSRELVEGYLARIDAYDREGPALNAIVNVGEGALRRAEELDEALSRTGELVGPLHGIPVLVKDCIETEDIPTTFGSEVFSGYRPKEDATLIRNLREAGAILLAKTTLPDFATSWWAYSSVSGETRNPYALDRDPGGSSSGTGAAVAANLGAVGLGTDCGGSIRLPASFDNVVGVRSTPGLVSRNGVGCLVFFQDTIGPMTRTVADAAVVMDALVGYDPADSLTAAYIVARAPRSYTESLDPEGLRGARVGLVTNVLGSDEDEFAAPVNRVVAGAVAAIREAGGEVVEVEIPDLSHHLGATSMYVDRTKHDINEFLAARPDAPVKTLQEIYESKRYHPRLDLLELCATEGPEDPRDDPEYFRRFAAREEFTRTVLNVLAGNRLDAFVYPSVQVAPPTRELLDSGRWTTLTFPTNTLIASQSWLPAITVPGGYTEEGLPVGMEFVTRPYDEPAAFRFAYAFEQATKHRRPPESAPELTS